MTKRARENPLEEAIRAEEEIGREAAEIRDGATGIDEALLSALWPLLRRPIPEGFIEEIPAVKGKPYESTGVKSMQVQINRMDLVLGPTNWGWRTEWLEDGAVAEVTVWIGAEDTPLVRRSARGGVDRASGTGNQYKGTETNAGKLAFARIGPGWQVYVGAADLDPDTNRQIADAQTGGEGRGEGSSAVIGEQRGGDLEAIVKAAGVEDNRLVAKLRSFGVKTCAELTEPQGLQVYEWVQQLSSDGGGSDG